MLKGFFLATSIKIRQISQLYCNCKNIYTYIKSVNVKNLYTFISLIDVRFFVSIIFELHIE